MALQSTILDLLSSGNAQSQRSDYLNASGAPAVSTMPLIITFRDLQLLISLSTLLVSLIRTQIFSPYTKSHLCPALLPLPLPPTVHATIACHPGFNSSHQYHFPCLTSLFVSFLSSRWSQSVPSKPKRSGP